MDTILRNVNATSCRNLGTTYYNLKLVPMDILVNLDNGKLISMKIMPSEQYCVNKDGDAKIVSWFESWREKEVAITQDIAWFEELEQTSKDSFGGGVFYKVIKVLKVKINGEWVTVPTIHLI